MADAETAVPTVDDVARAARDVAAVSAVTFSEALRALEAWAGTQAELRRIRATIEPLTDLLNRALDEGRNIMPGATDNEAHAIEALAVKCLAILDAP